MTNLQKIKKELNSLGDKKRAISSARFFKTGSGDYGEGDVFLGITVPIQRSVAKKYLSMDLNEVEELLKSKIHEHRLVALLILVEKFKKSDKKIQEKIYKLYLKNTKLVNNWDLVDLSTHYIVGQFLIDKPRDILYKLVKSKLLWDRRIAMVSTWIFIRNNDFKDVLGLAELLLKDKHDLIHKAVGWMLREMGKKDQKILIKFLDEHTLEMPRTMLRYSIEKFDEKKRKYYLKLVK